MKLDVVLENMAEFYCKLTIMLYRMTWPQVLQCFTYGIYMYILYNLVFLCI